MEIYCAYHCTNLFVSLKHFNEAVQAGVFKGFDSAFSAYKLQRLLWKSDKMPLNFDDSNILRTQDLEPL